MQAAKQIGSEVWKYLWSWWDKRSYDPISEGPPEEPMVEVSGRMQEEMARFAEQEEREVREDKERERQRARVRGVEIGLRPLSQGTDSMPQVHIDMRLYESSTQQADADKSGELKSSTTHSFTGSLAGKAGEWFSFFVSAPSALAGRLGYQSIAEPKSERNPR